MGRTPCCSKDSMLNRGAWTAQEDSILSEYIKIHGEGRWRSIPQNTGLKRCGKSCRLHWLNYLRPDIKRGHISPDEEDLILRLHGLLGNRWSLIAGRLPSRTDNEIKNYWNTHLRKKTQSLPEKKTLPKPAFPAGDRMFKSSPVKAKAVRLRKGENKYGSISGISTHQEMSSPITAIEQRDLISCESLIKEDDSQSTHFPMEKNMVKSQSPSMEIDGQYAPCYTPISVDYQSPHSEPCAESGVNTFESLLYMNELSSPEFDACTSSKIDQLLDNNIQQVNSFTASDEQANKEIQQKGDWVEELQYQQKSSLQWLSLLLLESEEDWEERNNIKESAQFS
ncbi:hypothetical protein SUGI_1003150 [Cryptomeria japonica]|uniref:transcription factor MYB1 n=1 Tax=Cryptomeria japonica TaxID=3369 RepID=UPI0024146BDA|nr:transcription factor MYB1 [Cryptomeria japonica]GLJ47514.1 hypothetical protein SUGI_1003150 [Cryptomeria japonica]